MYTYMEMFIHDVWGKKNSLSTTMKRIHFKMSKVKRADFTVKYGWNKGPHRKTTHSVMLHMGPLSSVFSFCYHFKISQTCLCTTSFIALPYYRLLWFFCVDAEPRERCKWIVKKQNTYSKRKKKVNSSSSSQLIWIQILKLTRSLVHVRCNNNNHHHLTNILHIRLISIHNMEIILLIRMYVEVFIISLT